MVNVLNARPRASDQEIRAEGIRKLAAECAKWDGDETPDEWECILGKCWLDGNGYEIARELDNDHYVHGIDLELVEILESASSYIWSAEREAVARWVADNNIRPSLAVGDRITCRHGAGTINGIDEKQGYYLLKPDDETERYKPGGGICVPYEDATPASCDTHPQGENAPQSAVEFMSDAVPHEDAGDAQTPPLSTKGTGAGQETASGE